MTRSVAASADNTTSSPAVKALRAAWLQKKAQIFAGKLTKPDAEDLDTVNHLNWYVATGFTRPYPARKQFGRHRPAPPSRTTMATPARFADRALSLIIGERAFLLLRRQP